MTRIIESLFTPDDQKRIEEAVKQAETQTSGEIIPYAVYASDVYEEALLRGGMMFGALALCVLIVIHMMSESWMPFGITEITLITLGASIAGMLITHLLKPAKRFFAGKKLLEHRANQRAAEAFLAEEVFQTRGRTGILLFLSVFERKVVVVGDSGINAKVQKSDWDEVVRIIVAGMRTNKPGEGLIEAIGKCGELLHREGLAIKSDDKDELSNRMRMRDE